ncbi:MAG: hypothetical protein RLZZ184_18 [Cyanobacteriota bacterium]|jgi:hypothetical protein
MPSSITSILSAPYLSKYVIRPTLTVVSNTANIIGHPFQTGDRLFTVSEDGNAKAGTLKYAIRVDANNLSVATTSANASNGIKDTLTSSTAIGNTLVYYNPNIGASPNFPFASLDLANFLASSKSQQAFAVNDNVQIDFSAPSLTPMQPSSGTWNVDYCFGLISDVGGYICYVMDISVHWRGDNISGVTWVNTPSKSFWTNTWRILIQNRQVYIQNRQTDNSYLTTFTSSVLALNISGLRLYFNSHINGQALTNCQITYF